MLYLKNKQTSFHKMSTEAKTEEVWSVWSYELREGISSNGDAVNVSQQILHKGDSEKADDREAVEFGQINRLFRSENN